MKKIAVSFLLILCVGLVLTSVSATSFLNNVLSQANGFNGSDTTGLGAGIKAFINDTIVPVIGLIGNLIFAGVTVILGMKYIWSSAEGKAEVSESLPAFVLGVVFFYLAETLVTYFTGATSSMTNSWNSFESSVWGVIHTIVQMGSFGGILFLGLKYMFASAEGKAQVKTNFGVLALGLLLVFSASNVVSYIIGLGSDVLGK